MDSAGYIYVTGETAAANFPAIPGAYATSGSKTTGANNGACNQGVDSVFCTDVFVLKLSPSGDS